MVVAQTFDHHWGNLIRNGKTNQILVITKIEVVLLQTDGVLLLSIPGIGIVKAAELQVETDQFRCAVYLLG